MNIIDPYKLVKDSYDKVMNLINAGEEPTEALYKIAKEDHLNPHYIKRVAELTNVALFYKNAKVTRKLDAEYPIADAYHVIERLFGETSIPLFAEKAKKSSFILDIPFQEGTTEIFDKIAFKARKEIIKKANKPELTLEKAYSFRKTFRKAKTEAEAKAENFVFSAFSTLGELKQYFQKDAAHRCDTQDFIDAVRVQYNNENIEQILEKVGVMYSLEKGQLNDISYPLKLWDRLVEQTKAYKKWKKAAKIYGLLEKLYEHNTKQLIKESGPKLFSIMDVLQTFKNVKDKIKEKGKSRTSKELEEEDLLTSDPTLVQLENALANLDRKFALDEILATDPLIRKYPPQDILQVYSQILKVAPRLVEEPEILRSLLRQLLAAQALTPHDLTQLIEADLQKFKKELVDQRSQYTGATKDLLRISRL